MGVLLLIAMGFSGETAKETAVIERFLADKETGIPASVKVQGGALVHTT